MGNCAIKIKKKADDEDAPVYDNAYSKPTQERIYEESYNEKPPNDVIFMTQNAYDKLAPIITPIRDLDGDDEEYYHSDEGESEDYSEWEIIDFGRDMRAMNGRWSTGDRVLSLQTLNTERNRSRSRRSASRVRFSAFEEQQIYDDGFERSNLAAQRGRSDTTRSMESVMSDSSVMSTATLNDVVYDTNLLPTRIQVFLNYDQKIWLLRLGVKQLECSLDPMYENHRVYWQVQITLLPYKNLKRHTKYKRSSNPVFNQAFEVKRIGKSVLSDMSVRYRVYGRFGQAGRKRLAGEVHVELGSLTRQPGNTVLEWRTLRTSRNRLVRRESLEFY